MAKLFLSLFLLPLCLVGCVRDNVPAGRILVKNDSQDREYNVLEVSAAGSAFRLSPGEKTLLPRGTRAITFRRRYRDHTREYSVECPDNLEHGISIKLIDVHVNRIAGGCNTVRAGKY